MKKGYKVFNEDWTCRGFEFEVGQTYEHKGTLSVCNSGFHFCEKVADCFNYYSLDQNNKVAEVVAHGEVKTEADKSCTDKIEIVREIAWSEMLELANTGKSNTGLNNTGNWNTGHWNTGNWNTGHGNTGMYNATNYSSGFFCTEEPKVKFFNEDSDMTRNEFYCTEAYRILPAKLTMAWFNGLSTSEKKELAKIPNYTEGKMVALITKMEAIRSEANEN